MGAFAQCAVFALWKFAASKEAYERDGATQAAIGLSMEGMTLAHLAIALDASEIELARETQNLTQTTGQAVNQTIAAKKQQSRAIRGAAATLGMGKGLSANAGSGKADNARL